MPDSPAAPTLSLNPNPKIEVYKIGKEAQPVFVVDDVLLNAEALLDFAAQTPFGAPAPNSYYPGLVADIPQAYLATIVPVLQRPLVQLFGLPPEMNNLRRYGFFGLSTVASKEMSARQALPHTDSANLNSFATVHYLSTGFGGTAFYRHKATGFEVISNFRAFDFNKLRAEEIAARNGTPDELLNELYEEIAYIEPAFNRLILYRATQLHSARLEQADQLSSDPRTGRLSLNGFLNT